ncbi:MAG TPA: SET domain-containing protein-lysine N-methyltransferase [Ferruginibacter sp.]|nr:SET domain-containing protein-lysine N-methyltransferase [Ferruginibacter sp.]
MNICILQPDYSTTSVDYKNYDPKRDLTTLLPGHEVDHIFLNKLTTYNQLKKLGKKKYDVFVNLCEGYLEWEVPSVEVIYFLELLNLPFTGPTSILYDPPKDLMKYVAYTEGVTIPKYALIRELKEIKTECAHLSYPLFVKPVKAGDSLGIDDKSCVFNQQELIAKASQILEEYGPLLVEEYVEGREFTVMVLANADDQKSVTVFKPVEYLFPKGKRFKTYSLKTSELHPESNVGVEDGNIDRQLREAAAKIFKGFGGVGYARLDFRMNAENVLYFLEINFTCSIFYSDGYEGSADHILKTDGIGQEDFLSKIIEEGIARFKRNQVKYKMKGNAISGFGIYATSDIIKGEIIFKGEESAQRLVTKNHILRTWDEKEKENFEKYAYPISSEIFLMWDQNPSKWAPQNHSCKPNTAYTGLNVIATKNIHPGEELTLDYSTFLDENMQSFACRCGSDNCRRIISGTPANSVTIRELQKKSPAMEGILINQLNNK